MSATLRPPAVAGRFYPLDRDSLLAEMRTFLLPSDAPLTALGCIVPHAGYMYSGHVAGAVFGRIEVPPLCIVMCPNHTGLGRPLAIMSEGTWQTPLGPAKIDTDVAEALKENLPALNEDTAAHRAEHAIEVQLPFLLSRQPHLKFVPITLGTGDLGALRELGEAIANVVAVQSEPVLIVASSDMNHYESDRVTRMKDHRAIDRILDLDPAGLFDVVTHEDISMCGFGPAVAMLTAARKLGATEAELVRYATSGDVSGDREMVVGYAGIVVR